MARQHTDDVEFSPEDACRSELPFLFEVLTAVIEAGATTLNIPDTVGYVLPYEYGQIIAKNSRKRQRYRKGGHQHPLPQRFGHGDGQFSGRRAVNGARQVECTITGWAKGRANAAMEEIVMAIQTRQNFFGEGLTTNIKTQEIYRTSQMVSQMTAL